MTKKLIVPQDRLKQMMQGPVDKYREVLRDLGVSPVDIDEQTRRAWKPVQESDVGAVVRFCVVINEITR